MNRQIIRSDIIIDTGQPDITLGKKQHVWCCAGNEEVRADIEFLPFQEQGLVDVPVRAAVQRAAVTHGIHSSPKTPPPVCGHPRPQLFVPFSRLV